MYKMNSYKGGQFCTDTYSESLLSNCRELSAIRAACRSGRRHLSQMDRQAQPSKSVRHRIPPSLCLAGPTFQPQAVCCASPCLMPWIECVARFSTNTKLRAWTTRVCSDWICTACESSRCSADEMRRCSGVGCARLVLPGACGSGSPRSARSVVRGASATYLSMASPECRAKIRILEISIPCAAKDCAPVTRKEWPP
jgi:hypothetical protein